MKKALLLFSVAALFLASCQPDSKEDATPSTGFDFVGTWNRDTVIVNDIAPNGLKTRLDTNPNHGIYTFNSDKSTGILDLYGTKFAITWNFKSTGGTLTVSEIDWPNQTYAVAQTGTNQYKLTGYKDMGDGFQNERILYLTKK